LPLSERGCGRHHGGGQSSGEQPQNKAHGERPVYLKGGAQTDEGGSQPGRAQADVGTRRPRIPSAHAREQGKERCRSGGLGKERMGG
jgi:hypothetical protein